MCSVITKGTTPTTLGFDFSEDGVPFLRAQNVFGSVDIEQGTLFISPQTHAALSRSSIAPGDVLLTIAGTIGRTAIVPLDAPAMNCNQAVAILRPIEGLDRKYLFHWLQSQDATGQIFGSTVTGTISNLSLGQISGLQLSLPPLDEQRRIVAILDKADALRQKRKRAIALLDSLTQSIFLEMFGDLSNNTRNWPTASIGELCQRLCVGIVVTPAAYYQQSGIPALRSLNIDIDDFKLSDLVFVSAQDNDTKLKKSKLSRGDVVIVRTGQPGKAAVITPELDGVNAIDLLIASPNRSKLEPQFLSSLMNSEIGRRLVLSEKRGQIQQHLNVGSLKSAVIPVPPIVEQKKFVAVWDQLCRSILAARNTSAEVDTLFSSLQHRAFSGQL